MNDIHYENFANKRVTNFPTFDYSLAIFIIAEVQ